MKMEIQIRTRNAYVSLNVFLKNVLKSSHASISSHVTCSLVEEVEPCMDWHRRASGVS
jgi:hypothetical protein